MKEILFIIVVSLKKTILFCCPQRDNLEKSIWMTLELVLAMVLFLERYSSTGEDYGRNSWLIDVHRRKVGGALIMYI